MGFNLENLINIRLKTQNIKKEGFPIPSPDGGEEEDKYISRCISAIIDEYGQEQGYAICKSKWDEK
jgi:hypothetical protein